jgi:hypothetical protein
MGRHRTSPGTTTLRLLGPDPRPRPHTPVAHQPRAPPRRAATSRNPRRRRARSATHDPAQHNRAPLSRCAGEGSGEGPDGAPRNPLRPPRRRHTIRPGGPPSRPSRARAARNPSALPSPPLSHAPCAHLPQRVPFARPTRPTSRQRADRRSRMQMNKQPGAAPDADTPPPRVNPIPSSEEPARSTKLPKAPKPRKVEKRRRGRKG